MKIQVVNRKYFEQIKGTKEQASHFESYNIISINTPEYKPKAFRQEFPPFSKRFFCAKNLLTLKFHDYYKPMQGVVLMTQEDGQKIKQFVDKIDKSKTLYVHCTAGISRSRTIALCLSLYCNVICKNGNKEDYYQFLNKYRDGMRVNYHVKNIMYKVFGINELKDEMFR